MSDPNSQPMLVNQSSSPEQMGAAIRTLLLALGGYAVGRGWLDANIMTAAVAVLMLVVPALWAQFTAHHVHDKLVTAARAAPDEVAQIVGETKP